MAQDRGKTTARDLRLMLLDRSRSDAFPLTARDGQKLDAFLLEMGADIGAIALLLAADGAISLYQESGAGDIGLGHYYVLAKGAAGTLEVAAHFREFATPTTDFAYPADGEVFFWFVTKEDVRLRSRPMAEMAQGTDSESKFFRLAFQLFLNAVALRDKLKSGEWKE